MLDDMMGLLYDALFANDEEAKAEVVALFNELSGEVQ